MRFLAIFLPMFFLISCTTNQLALPTLVQFPTETPTKTSEPTRAFTATYTPTITYTPSSTYTPTNTPTNTPTDLPTSLPQVSDYNEAKRIVVEWLGSQLYVESVSFVQVDETQFGWSVSAFIILDIEHDPLNAAEELLNYTTALFADDGVWLFVIIIDNYRQLVEYEYQFESQDWNIHIVSDISLSTPMPTPTPDPNAPCSCTSDYLNCSSFGSQSSAQACFSYCSSQFAGDIHNLDGDNNGLACENL